MDEPFSALDVQTRALMSDELLELWDGTGASVVFVTHDLEESIALADKVVVMTAGPATVKEVFEIDLPRPRKVESGASGAQVPGDLPGDLVLAGRRGPHHPREGCPRCRLIPSPRAPPSPRPRRDPGQGASHPPPQVPGRSEAGSLLLVAVIGLWEWLARTAVIDPFNFSMPSKIWDQIRTWVIDGTAQGSLWRADLVHALRSAARLGHRCDRRCASSVSRSGRIRFARRCPRPVHQGAQRHAAHRARPDLPDLVRPRPGLEGGLSRRPRVLPRLLQRLPGRPGGRPQPRRQRPHSGRQQPPGHASRSSSPPPRHGSSPACT